MPSKNTKTWTITKAAPDSNTKTWTDLPSRDANGNTYSYRAIETAITLTASAGGQTITAAPTTGDPTSGTVGGFNYTSTTTPATTTITNNVNTTIKPGEGGGEGSTTLTATKVWNDTGAGNTRPETVTFHLLRNGTKLEGYDKTLNAPDWKTSWTGLPASDAGGNSYTYTVSETAPGYVPEYSGDMKNGFTVKNTPTTVTLSKVDASNIALTGAVFTVTPVARTRSGSVGSASETRF